MTGRSGRNSGFTTAGGWRRTMDAKKACGKCIYFKSNNCFDVPMVSCGNMVCFEEHTFFDPIMGKSFTYLKRLKDYFDLNKNGECEYYEES